MRHRPGNGGARTFWRRALLLYPAASVAFAVLTAALAGVLDDDRRAGGAWFAAIVTIVLCVSVDGTPVRRRERFAGTTAGAAIAAAVYTAVVAALG